MIFIRILYPQLEYKCNDLDVLSEADIQLIWWIQKQYNIQFTDGERKLTSMTFYKCFRLLLILSKRTGAQDILNIQLNSSYL